MYVHNIPLSIHACFKYIQRRKISLACKVIIILHHSSWLIIEDRLFQTIHEKIKFLLYISRIASHTSLIILPFPLFLPFFRAFFPLAFYFSISLTFLVCPPPTPPHLIHPCQGAFIIYF